MITTSVTLLRSFGPRLAKLWLPDGSIAAYDDARTYSVTTHPIAGVAGLLQTVERLAKSPQHCLIRGVLADPDNYTGRVERNLDTFRDAPSRLFVIDLDNFTPTVNVLDDPEAAVYEAIATLPACFQNAACVYQLSGSCGHKSAGNKLKAHLYYLLNDPLTCEEAEAWALKYLPGTDNVVHRTVQVNYTASPVMGAGVTDPLAGRRVGLIASLDECVSLPDSMPVPDVSQVRRVTRAERLNLVDSRAKPGLIGAVCRAIPPEELPRYFPDHFEACRKPERMTWLKGGGGKEGLRISDTGTHVYNSHATAPLRKAAHVFDFIKAHVFGHLDADMDPDALELDPASAPSWVAMKVWATSVPAVQQELQRAPKDQGAGEAPEAKPTAVAEAERQAQQARFDQLLKSISDCPSMTDLQIKITPRLRKMLLQEWERETIAKAIQAKTLELTGTKLPVGTARKMVTPLAPVGGPTFPFMTAEGVPKACIENIQALCAHLGSAPRFNLLTRRVELVGNVPASSPENAEANQTAYMLSECRKVSMSLGLTELKGYLLALADANPFNPVLAWLESEEWDGRSRLQELMDTLTLAPHQPRALAQTLMRTWLIQSVALIASPEPLQARGVLTLVGGQNKGKSRWFKALCGDLPHLFKEGHILNVQDKDSVMQATTRWICELGEIEGTFKRSDQAAFKAFMAAEHDVYRRAYATDETRAQRRTSFCGSVNFSEFLTDESGNSRIWPIEVESVNPDHQVNMQQLWAEVLYLWRMHEAHYLEREDMDELMDASQVHAVVNPLDELIRGHFPWEDGQADPESVDWELLRATDILRRVHWDRLDKYAAGVAGRVAAAMGAAKVRGGKKYGGGWVYRVPVEKGTADQLTLASGVADA